MPTYKQSEEIRAYRRKHYAENKEKIMARRRTRGGGDMYRANNIESQRKYRESKGIVTGQKRCGICREKGHSRRTCPHGDNPLMPINIKAWDYIEGEIIVYCPPAK